MPRLTVIIPTYNAIRYLDECIESIRKQTYDDWELIVVDRGSTDGTVAYLESVSRTWTRMRVLHGGSERTSQANIGVRDSQSEYIYYTGADFTFDPALLQSAVQRADETHADGVWITNVSVGDGFWARVRNLERSTYIGSVRYEGVRFFRRSAYMAAGGYSDTIPIFEEYDLQERLLANGAQIARISDAKEYHLGEPQSLREIWNKSFYYGRMFREVLRERGAGMIAYGSPVRATYFKSWRQFAANPVLTFGFIVMLVTKHVAGAAGLASSFLRRQVST